MTTIIRENEREGLASERSHAIDRPAEPLELARRRRAKFER
jgi:hypothetical protein